MGAPSGDVFDGRELPPPLSASAEQLLESAPDAMIIVDAAGLIRFVNRQSEVLFGYDREELVGQVLGTLVPDWVKEVHPRHRAEYCAHPVARPMGTLLAPAARRKDGSEFPVAISLSSVETEDGLLVSAAVRDMTDRKRIEAERALVEGRIVEAEHDEERALLEGQLHQAQRLESIGQLARGVAHDFNNLLAGIMNYAALVALSLQDVSARHEMSDDESFVTLAQDVQAITDVAKRAAALTRQLLIFSRREVVQPDVLDLQSVVVDMENLLRTTIGDNVELRTTFETDLPQINADRGQIEQVLMNLAVNARDAMPNGGTLDIAVTRFDVDEHYRGLRPIPPGTYVQLTVTDTGVGMPGHVRDRAFEPFYTTKSEGSGLGLATVYGIATQAGGDVGIYSEPQLGTTVRLNFPMTTDETRRRPQESDRAASTATIDETILLVEDEQIVRESTRRMLAREGYTVLTATNADDALAIVHEHAGEIHLLLTDVVMPGRSGKALSVAVGELRPATRILFMSGYGHDLIVDQGVLEEGVHLIEKPFSAENLFRVVRDILDG